MKEFTAKHACPFLVTRKWGPDRDWDADDQPCEGDVLLVYDVGKGPQEFYLQVESAACANGHDLPEDVLSAYWTEDYADLASQEQERAMEAYQLHIDSLIDRSLGK